MLLTEPAGPPHKPLSACVLPAAAEILEGALPQSFHSRLAYLSGPSFAAEVARELPTVVTIAAKVRAVTCSHSPISPCTRKPHVCRSPTANSTGCSQHSHGTACREAAGVERVSV